MRYLTAGESHGKALVVIVEGFPKGFLIDQERLERELARRKQGYGRGARMRMEPESISVLSGLRNKVTLGSPISMLIENKDWRIFPFAKDKEKIMPVPRPAHADLAGMLKYETDDARDILERASARETAARVAVGALCEQALSIFGIEALGYVTQIGKVQAAQVPCDLAVLKKLVKSSQLNCPDKLREKDMIEDINRALEEKDTLGGVCEVRVHNVPAGLGSCMQWDKKLDAQLAYHLMSIPAIKAVAIGAGCEYAQQRGFQSHDAIIHSSVKGFYHQSNNSGGIEGGMSNGEDIVVRAYMKPIPTLRQALASVNIRTKKATAAPWERSDTVAVTSASIVAEHVCSFVVLDALLHKFGGDTKRSLEGSIKAYRRYLKER